MTVFGNISDERLIDFEYSLSFLIQWLKYGLEASILRENYRLTVNIYERNSLSIELKFNVKDAWKIVSLEFIQSKYIGILSEQRHSH